MQENRLKKIADFPALHQSLLSAALRKTKKSFIHKIYVGRICGSVC